MKTHFYLLLFGSFTAVSTVSHAALFTPYFVGLADDAPLVPNGGVAYDGWTQSEMNPEDDDGEHPLAYGHSVEMAPGVVYQGVSLGAYNSIPSGDTLHIDHAVGGDLVGATISLSFLLSRFELVDEAGELLLDEFGVALVNPQNTFEIGAYSTSGGNLFSFVAGATIDPTVWNMYYRVGSGSNQLVSSNYAISLGQVSTMTLSFTGSGADALFNLSVIGPRDETGQLITVTKNGTMTGMATETFDDFRVSMLKAPGTTAGEPDSYGTNSITIVPEPGSAALLGLAAGVVMLRRRRA
jgi:hypothetical protein